VSHDLDAAWPPDVHTLAVDIGGSGLKAAVLDATGQMVTERLRVATPYPCPPPVLVSALADLVAPLPTYHRVSVGFPGMVRGGRVIHVPSLSRRTYSGAEDPLLRDSWTGFDLAGAIADTLERPVKVANDADVQGCAVVEGTGFEFVMTLGTGCGTAMFLDGRLLPHLELSHAPFRKGGDFDDQIGNIARKAIGNERWRVRVRKAIAAFDRVLFFDRVYIGGGNAKHLSVAELGPKAVIVPNTAGILGGLRIWDLEG
jgi:polyphosphate glucokinase